MSPLSSGSRANFSPVLPSQQGICFKYVNPFNAWQLTQTPRTKAMFAETSLQDGAPHSSEQIRSTQENPSSILLVLQFSLLRKKCIHGPTKNICMLPTYYTDDNFKCVWHSRKKKFWLQKNQHKITNSLQLLQHLHLSSVLASQNRDSLSPISYYLRNWYNWKEKCSDRQPLL